MRRNYSLTSAHQLNSHEQINRVLETIVFDCNALDSLIILYHLETNFITQEKREVLRKLYLHEQHAHSKQAYRRIIHRGKAKLSSASCFIQSQ
jgi:uncharacterized membrane protein YgaE (UPF0421/DUF939 family)